MHSSNYKWKMAITCNPPITLCATFFTLFYVYGRASKCKFHCLLCEMDFSQHFCLHPAIILKALAGFRHLCREKPISHSKQRHMHVFILFQTRVLVTHGINFLPRMDQILVLVDGCISERGTYRELLNKEGAFANFLKTYLEEHEESDDEDDDEGKLFNCYMFNVDGCICYAIKYWLKFDILYI